MYKSFSGKVALITGAGSGMGLATAKAFSEAGAAVALADVNEDSIKEAVKKLVNSGHKALAVRCDVTDERQVENMVDMTVKNFGKLDAAYNNAGIQSPMTDSADLTVEEFDHILAVNLRGVWLCMKHELLQMRKHSSGTIVNCSSLGGLVGLPGRSAYHAAKHGVLGLTKSAALEYANKGIRINAICPGTIDTPMVTSMFNSGDLSMDIILKAQPIGRLGKPEEIAAAVLWLCSSESSFVIGQALVADGGYTIQ
jgi:NAD(P)-dependent dehydrogenase (short-subunit alcohol dehydrogenase family)